MQEPVLLRMENITKTFPGVKALDKVCLEVKAGTVHALMGENGAGKSTLMKCLFGIYKKDGGQIFLDGKEVDFKSSREALDNGVAMVHQELNQALNRSVMDSEKNNGVKIFARSPMGRGYTLADAYDIKQTQGRDISRITLQNDSKEMEAALTTVLNYAVVPVVIDKELPAPAFYDSANLELAINPDYPDNEAFAAITAEVAHSRFHAKGANASYDRGECELDAQSISYILCRRYGIERSMPDMSNLAALYEGWEPQECRQALDNIQDTSKQFGRSIEKNLEMGKQRSRAPVHRPTR